MNTVYFIGALIFAVVVWMIIIRLFMTFMNFIGENIGLWEFFKYLFLKIKKIIKK
ncbi:hypothetical protein [Pseudobacteroides cellulosolvens]|uniref:Uncharacterized protein n=1 Tax=Pseudobacteroides cellulosolvens ATCC 35603 = DSM 2933 TaxID=398512 RepID=A0A0L6JXI3_9FIRM|nr:hypothetical protein [Pseudobacteroides cellulosolvens]KNY30551.1 hypothetical protein Bccel_5831 [Pseudobacteroides cellulosolvens ATCC 35603 = DSM 2933]KNY30566.1 hypothetical protein Bccel_5846 [Pseudobacteroides cellulosolvens ATCC 35603 = DSM 2933]